MNVRVEYELTPIRHVAVQCPKCNNWFDGREIVDDDNITYTYQLNHVDFICPVCGRIFNGSDGIVVKEVSSSEEVYKDCLKKKVVWQ